MLARKYGRLTTNTLSEAKRFIITAVMVVESLYAPDKSAISIKYKGNIIDWTDEADCYLTKEELIENI